MTDAQRRSAIIGLIERHTTANTTSKRTARAALIGEGLYTADGRLRPEFGGEAKKDKNSA